MAGYHARPDANEEATWVDEQGRRWLRTGDIGRLDEEGFLYIVDRKKDMILSGGQNIYPADIEAVMLEHPDVADVAVVGVPSERWGETPLAVVVARGRDATLDAAALVGLDQRARRPAAAHRRSGTAGFWSMPVRNDAVSAAIRIEPASAVPSDAPNWVAVFCRPPTSGLSLSGTADTVTAPSCEARPPSPSPINSSGPVTTSAVASTSIAANRTMMPRTTTAIEMLTTRRGDTAGEEPRHAGSSEQHRHRQRQEPEPRVDRRQSQRHRQVQRDREE